MLKKFSPKNCYLYPWKSESLSFNIGFFIWIVLRGLERCLKAIKVKFWKAYRLNERKYFNLTNMSFLVDYFFR
jgi:hypothetical protein